MGKIRYWLQRADYTSTEYDAVDAATAVRILDLHDWRAELEFEREREAAGLETCPPGIGFVADANRFLHICPGRDATALVHYHTDEPRLRLRTTPMLVGSAGVVVSAITASRFLTSGAVHAPDWFELRFEGGLAPRVFDDSEQYESFSIQPGDIFV